MSEIEPKANPNPKPNKVNLVLIILLMGSLASIAYFVSKQSTLNEDLQKLQANEKKMKDENKALVGLIDVEGSTGDLKKDLMGMLHQYDNLIKQDASKADSLGMQKERIMGLMQQINSLQKQRKITARDLIEMKKENETLRTIMKGYIAQIDKLNILNTELRFDLDRTETRLDSTSTERDMYRVEAERKTEQVKKGSVLQAYGFNSTGMLLKLNKTTKETERARRTIQIKSAFKIGANPIAYSGEKGVYMQVVDENGKTLQFRSNQVFSSNGTTIPYSEKRTIDYQNKSIDVAIYYDLRGKEISKGVYNIKIYCENNLIGTDTFTLK